MDKELEYYKSKASLLEKENKDLKEKLSVVEERLIDYMSEPIEYSDKDNKAIKEAIEAKKTYEEGMKRLRVSLEQSTRLLRELTKFNSFTQKEYKEKVNKEIENITNVLKNK